MGRRLRAALVALGAAAALGACSTSVSGQGTLPSAGVGSSSPDFPTGTSGASGSAPTTPASSSTPAPATSSSPAPSAPTRQQREDRLTAQTNGEAHTLAPVPGGYEAATYDRVGGIQFWRSVGASVDWRQVGASSYPDEVTGKPYAVQVAGALLRGMQHATFIVAGQFTQDGSGLAVAYTTGPRGWGAIKAEPDGNIGPSGQPVGSDLIGLSRGFGFTQGELVTQDCPQNRPISDCGGHEVTKRWVWTGHDFRQVG